MEKVIRACIALLLGIFLFACGGKQQGSDTATDNSVQVDSTTAADTILQQVYAPVSEIFEYRSESLSNYELYGVYPYQDAPVFVAVRNGKARLLKLDEEREVEEGQALDDEEFVAAKFLEEATADGITTFGQIELTTRADVNVVFNHAFVKRSLTLGDRYSFTSTDGSGLFILSPNGDQHKVVISITAGSHTCDVEGNIHIKGNVGYLQGNADEHCKLFFYFTDKQVQSLQISGNSECDCGANTSLNQIFGMK